MHGIIERDDTILVIIDVQEKLLPVMFDRELIIKNIEKLVRFSLIASIPIIITEQEKLGSTVKEVKNLIPGIEPIRKIHFNCFFCEPFTEKVKSLSRKTLVLAGIEAHICVAQTALFALPDFCVHVISDAISSRNTQNRDISIQRMMQAGATISSTEMFIYEVLKRAGTEEFKATLELVK